MYSLDALVRDELSGCFERESLSSGSRYSCWESTLADKAGLGILSGSELFKLPGIGGAGDSGAD